MWPLMRMLMRRKRYDELIRTHDELIRTLNDLHKSMVELRAVLDGLEAIVQLAEENRKHSIIHNNQRHDRIS